MANRDSRDPLLSGTARLLRFENRLALSASVSADVLLDLWDFEPQSTNDSAVAGESHSLVEQAVAIQDEHGLGGAGQTVAVIDSGIAYDHVALGGGYGPGYRVVGGWDFAENDANPYDDGPSGFHGTHVAGLLAGATDEFLGIAPDTDLVALRVFDDLGNGNLDWVEDALAWVHENQSAFENPITTVNLSLGAALPDEIAGQVYAQLEDELSLLKADGIMVFAAAGNAFDAAAPDEIAYPAASPNVTAIGSVGGSSDLSEFSQRTDGLLVAPGEHVFSSVPDHVLGRDGDIDDFVHATGTSMASPQVAGAAMLVREAMQSVGISPDADEVMNHLRNTSDARIDDATGIRFHEINLTRAIESLLTGDSGGGDDASSETDPESEPVDPPDSELPTIDLGAIRISEVQLESGQWYEATATQDGLFSIATSPINESYAITITAADGTSLSQSVSTSDNQHDVAVRADQKIRFRLGADAEGPVTAEIANVVNVLGSESRVSGTDAAEDFELDLREGAMLRFGQFEYQLGDGSIDELQIEGGGGKDSISVFGSAGRETVTLRPGEGLIEAESITIGLTGIQRIDVDGGGGADRAYLYDSAGNDSLSAHPGRASLSGVGFENAVSGINSIYVHATAGGNDVAYLYDSEGDDRLAIRPDFTSLRGEAYFNLVFGFDRVSAYGTSGGNDSADLYDSPGDDRLSANASSAFISGPGYYSQARHFESVVGHATSGGNDRATLYADSADQTLHNLGSLVQLDAGPGLVRAARGFEVNETFLAGEPLIVTPQSLPTLAEPGATRDDSPQETIRLSEAERELMTSHREARIAQISDLLPDDRDDDPRQSLDELFAAL